MTIKSIWTRGLFAVLCVSAVFLACKYDGPAAIWDPNKDLGASPVITSVVPADSAVAGASEIILNGQNFSTDNTDLAVYFDNVAATIKSLTATQITLFRPPISGNNISIKVIMQSAYQLAKVTGYKITEVARLYGTIPSKNLINFISTDSQGNVFALLSTSNVLKISTQEVRTTVGAKGFRTVASDIKVGPDGDIYIQERSKTALYRMPAAGGDGVRYAAFPRNVFGFDFDANGYIYGAGNLTGVSSIKMADLTTQTSTEFQDVNVIGLRVFKGNVYACDSLKIWKSPILSGGGTLGPKETVFNIAEAGPYGTLSTGKAARILSFELADSGNLYVSLNVNGTANSPVLKVLPDGTISPLYFGILPANGGQLFWGSGNVLFLSMKSIPAANDLLQIDVGEKGAPK